MTEVRADPVQEVGGRRRGRWLWVLLLASLALNVLVAGTVGVAAWRMHREGSGYRGGGVGLIGFAATLPAGRREAIWAATSEQRGEMRPFRAEIRAARNELRAALVTDPFDRTRFERAQARVLEAEIHMRTAAQKLFVTLASQLTKEERVRFVERLTGGHGRARPGWFWRNRHGDGAEKATLPSPR